VSDRLDEVPAMTNPPSKPETEDPDVDEDEFNIPNEDTPLTREGDTDLPPPGNPGVS
jgi:hypothetical protein